MRGALALRALACALLVSCATAPPRDERVRERPAGLGQLQLRTLSEETVRLDDFRGRVILLDVWATWCDPCRESFPFYARLHRELGPRGFAVIAVSVDEDAESVRQFLAAEPVPFTVVLDPEAKVAEMLAVDTMPECYLIDRDGDIRLRHRGFHGRDEATLRAEIEHLLSIKR